jgi:2-keto-3-deoxygluconate transporter
MGATISLKATPIVLRKSGVLVVTKVLMPYCCINAMYKPPFILGNLDSDLRKFFGQAVAVMVPFFAFALGNNLDFRVILDTGLLGVLIGICVILVTGTTLVLADIFLARGNGTAGIGAASTAGAAVAVPTIIAGIEPRYAAIEPAATALVATSVVVTSLLTPILTAIWARRWRRTLGKLPAQASGLRRAAIREPRKSPQSRWS